MKITPPNIPAGPWEACNGMVYAPPLEGEDESQFICDCAEDEDCEAEEEKTIAVAIAAFPDVVAALTDLHTWLICPATDKETLTIMQHKCLTALRKAGCTITE